MSSDTCLIDKVDSHMGLWKVSFF